jgi:hypothetical protein
LIKNIKFLPIALISLFFIFIFSYYSIPTVFSGRDQGSLSEAAIRLTQNHQFYFSTLSSQEFFKIYGPGEALNFPGFDYTKSGNLITHFPLGYITWLAVFYAFFGLSGLVVANAVTLFIFLLCFFLIARLYLTPSSSVWAWVLALTSFSFMWFFKFTLSENLALAFFWFGLWEFLLFLKNEKNIHLFISVLFFITLTFTRIEAWAVLVMLFIVLYMKYRNWKIIKERFWRKEFLIPLALVIAIFLINIKENMPFYRVFAKGFLSSFFPNKGELDIPSYSPIFDLYLIKVLWLYTILNFLVLAFWSIIFFLKNKHYKLLTAAFVSLPILIYLINPSISSDHPWMLRRFVFVILPIAILYTVLFLDKFFSKKFFSSAILALLLAMNLIVFLPYVSQADNKNLLSQTQEMSQNFTDSDLILLDREASGDGWSMINGPMNFIYGKQAVYFFNPSDFEKIDTSKFSNIYLVIPDKNLDLYSASGILDQFSFWKEYEIENTSLDIKTGKKNDLYSQPVEFPQEVMKTTNGKIYKLK